MDTIPKYYYGYDKKNRASIVMVVHLITKDQPLSIDY